MVHRNGGHPFSCTTTKPSAAEPDRRHLLRNKPYHRLPFIYLSTKFQFRLHFGSFLFLFLCSLSFSLPWPLELVNGERLPEVIPLLVVVEEEGDNRRRSADLVGLLFLLRFLHAGLALPLPRPRSLLQPISHHRLIASIRVSSQQFVTTKQKRLKKRENPSVF